MSGDIARNILRVREQMEAACQRAGRRADEVRLVAVTKYVDTGRIAEAIAAGVCNFGENHAQELNQKKTFFEQHGCFVHFIGQLQTNKIKYVCGCVGVIESVDRPNLAELLQRRAESLGVVQEVLLQVNIGAEQQKGGVADVDLESFTESLARYSNLRVRGLMCVPPAVRAEEARRYFRRMRELFERMRGCGREAFDTLSMGMSHDFAIAIEEGATEIRVGAAIFGAREQR